jgi:two-component system, OmpR family, sensor kinase
MTADTHPSPEPSGGQPPEPPKRARRRHGSTVARLIAVQTLLVGIALTVVVVETGSIFAAQSRNTLQDDLREEVTEYTHAADIRPTGQTLFEFSRIYLQTRSLLPGHHLLVALTANPVLATPNTVRFARDPTIAALLTAPTSTARFSTARFSTTRVGTTDYQILLSPILDGSHQVGVLLPFVNLNVLSDQTSKVRTLAEVQAAIALLVTGLSSFLLLRHLLRTVGKVTATAEDIAAGDIQRRIDYHGTDDEVGRLAHTFDAMTARLSAALTSQRQLLSDVSHQLRTPLTVARGHLEVLLRANTTDPAEVSDTVSLVVDELHHATILVDRLMMLGRSLEPDFLDPQPIDIRAFMADLYDAATVLADRTWALGDLPDLVIHADATKLRGAMLNLIDNAIKATTTADTITLTAVQHEKELQLAVTDTGPGIPADLHDVIFDRFRRGRDPHQRGSGLGLAIVQAVAHAHHGTCQLTSTPGNGCHIAILLPLDDPRTDQEQP